MMNLQKMMLALTGMLAFASAHGAEHVIYPSAGQDRDQQASDEAQCFVWAKDESGVDPLTAEPAQIDAPDRARRRVP